mmetsp:Transcript_116870/g.162329  ORF Transcript_116870/g.162329 Transcript_116870/m.162329 type:complete len:214 (+) Transcript_116870:1196-1837(+)
MSLGVRRVKNSFNLLSSSFIQVVLANPRSGCKLHLIRSIPRVTNFRIPVFKSLSVLRKLTVLAPSSEYSNLVKTFIETSHDLINKVFLLMHELDPEFLDVWNCLLVLLDSLLLFFRIFFFFFLFFFTFLFRLNFNVSKKIEIFNFGVTTWRNKEFIKLDWYDLLIRNVFISIKLYSNIEKRLATNNWCTMLLVGLIKVSFHDRLHVGCIIKSF